MKVEFQPTTDIAYKSNLAASLLYRVRTFGTSCILSRGISNFLEKLAYPSIFTVGQDLISVLLFTIDSLVYELCSDELYHYKKFEKKNSNKYIYCHLLLKSWPWCLF